jgi:hypothetical protein
MSTGLSKVIITILFLIGLASFGNPTPTITPSEDRKLFRTMVAQEIDGYYQRKGINTSAETIWSVVDEADKKLPEYFPDGTVTLEHVLAIAMCESAFIQRAIGPMGEKGIFQILRPKDALIGMGKPNADPFDPRVNTEMGVWILSKKYSVNPSLKRAIIAYNGIVRSADGKWNETYWHRFSEKDTIIKMLIEKAKRRQALEA